MKEGSESPNQGKERRNSSFLTPKHLTTAGLPSCGWRFCLLSTRCAERTFFHPVVAFGCFSHPHQSACVPAQEPPTVGLEGFCHDGFQVAARCLSGGRPLPVFLPVLFMPKGKHQAGPVSLHLSFPIPFLQERGSPEQRPLRGQAWRGARELLPFKTPAQRIQQGHISSAGRQAVHCMADTCALIMTLIIVVTAIIITNVSPALSMCQAMGHSRCWARPFHVHLTLRAQMPLSSQFL